MAETERIWEELCRAAQDVGYRTQNAALLVNLGPGIFRGEAPEWYCRDVGTNQGPRHAEITAIIKGYERLNHVQPTLYAIWVACPQCAAAIIDAEVEVVVTHYDFLCRHTPPDWEDRVVEGLTMLRNHSVFVIDNPYLYTTPKKCEVSMRGKQVKIYG